MFSLPELFQLKGFFCCEKMEKIGEISRLFLKPDHRYEVFHVENATQLNQVRVRVKDPYFPGWPTTCWGVIEKTPG